MFKSTHLFAVCLFSTTRQFFLPRYRYFYYIMSYHPVQSNGTLSQHKNKPRVVYYRPQRSCYVFIRVCHSVNRGGGLPQCMLGYHPPQEGGMPLGSRPPPKKAAPRPKKEGPLGKQTPPFKKEADPPPPPPRIRSMSGRYASYWNAYLLKWVPNYSDKFSFKGFAVIFELIEQNLV